jgi:hypothetical protein
MILQEELHETWGSFCLKETEKKAAPSGTASHLYFAVRFNSIKIV